MDNIENKFVLSSSPHLHVGVTTSQVMRGVVFGLLPVIFAGIYFFRFRAFLLLVTCVGVSVLAELVTQKLRGQQVSLGDYSALLSGLLLALVLPPNLPLYAAGLGALFSVVVGKHLFGGLGKNIFNPALLGRAFLAATYPVLMTTWSSPVGFEAVTSATPLAAAKFNNVLTPPLRLFLGSVSGSLGETSALAILVGGIFIIARRYADWRIPCAIIGTIAGLSGIVWSINPIQFAPPHFHLLSGGLLIGALFMATDPVTSPVTRKGRWIFGTGIGVLTVVIRTWGGYPEGVMYSILLMNAATPLIDKFTAPVQFGGEKG